jgi:hypothetical protein
MTSRFVSSLLLAGLALFPLITRANDVQWDVMRLYPLDEKHVVAMAIPADWTEEPGAADAGTVGARQPLALHYRDAAGVGFEIRLTATVPGTVRTSIRGSGRGLDSHDYRYSTDGVLAWGNSNLVVNYSILTNSKHQGALPQAIDVLRNARYGERGTRM